MVHVKIITVKYISKETSIGTAKGGKFINSSENGSSDGLVVPQSAYVQ